MSEERHESSSEEAPVKEKSPYDQMFERRMEIFEKKGRIVSNPTDYEMHDVDKALEMSFKEDSYFTQEREERRLKEWYEKSIDVIRQKMRTLIVSLNDGARKTINDWDSPEEKKRKEIAYNKEKKNLVYETVIAGLHQLRQEKDYKILAYLEERDGSKDKKLEDDLEDLKKAINESLEMPEEKG